MAYSTFKYINQRNGAGGLMFKELRKLFLSYLSDEGGWVAAAVAIGSALTSAYGQYKAGQAQEAAAQKQAYLNFEEASEVLRRNEINNELLRESALVTQGSQTVQSFGSGKTLASSRDLIEQTMDSARRQIDLNTQAAEWEARMIRLGAESQLQSSEEIAEASMITSISTAGFGMANAYQNSPSYGSDTSYSATTN